MRLARERGWGVSVRSGGHSWGGWSVREGALLIDLGALRELTYADGEVATASPAIKGGARARRRSSHEHGRTFTGGHCESVGLGGFLLQGGQGWNSRRWGWGCENVVGIDVVTADGELVHADAQTNTKTSSGRRAGAAPRSSASSRASTCARIRAEPMYHDTRVFALDQLEPLLHWLHDVLPTLDVARRARDGGDPRRAHRDRAAAAHDADRRPVAAPRGARRSTPLRVMQERGPTTIADENVAMTLQNPEHHRYAADSQWTDADAATLYPLLRDIYDELPSEHSFSIWYGWAPSRPLPDMAFSLERNVYLATYAIWTDPADDERNRDWVHGHTARLATVGDGVYVGDSDFTRRPDRYLERRPRARGSRPCARSGTPISA